MTQALYFIISALAHLVILVFLLRFWLPLMRVDFRNPLAQAILRLTSPLISPVRRLLPPVGRVDTATVLVLFALQVIVILLLLALSGLMFGPLAIAIVAIIELAVYSLYLFLFVVFISVILSWIAPHNYNPTINMLNTLAEPVLRPFRRLVPTLGGIDISPIFALILLQAGVILLRSFSPFLV